MFEEFYGLVGRPFQLTPDPAFYFESQTHRKALSYLSYGLAQGEGFIVITGEAGAGKSTLARHLLATIDRTGLTAAEFVSGRFAAEDIVGAVAHAFGLAVNLEDKAGALGAIEAFLHGEARAGRRCLLVVDEAQNLSAEALEELRMLSNFQLGAHPLLQILLLGQEGLRDTLRDQPRLEHLRQRVIAAHHLEALCKDEIEPYICHRLGKVGWAGRPGFAPDVFPALFRASGGVPRRLNQLVSRLLMLGAVERREALDRAMVEQVGAELAGGEPTPAPPPAAPANVALAGLAAHDAQIAELQQAVRELANGERGGEQAALIERLGTLEARVFEQERTLRHTLTMLIEWIEREQPPRAAA